MLAAALTARLLLQFLLLITLALWGYRQGASIALGIVLALAAGSAGALVWRLFVSPDRRFDLGRIQRLLLELALFATGAAALWHMDHPLLSLLLFAAACADRYALIWLHRRELKRRYSWR
jgi:hypothetical protein